MSRTEYLDMRAASERLWDAMRKRPDAGVAVWLDVALNGWGNPDVCPKCGEDHAYCDPTDQCKEGTT